jgi:hypothetical protein
MFHILGPSHTPCGSLRTPQLHFGSAVTAQLGDARDRRDNEGALGEVAALRDRLTTAEEQVNRTFQFPVVARNYCPELCR